MNLHLEDLPSDVDLVGDIAVDTEAMGLNIQRDRLCLVQICDSASNVHMVKFSKGSSYSCPVMRSFLLDEKRQKIFHYARFDVSIMRHYLRLSHIPNIFCTKIASRFGRTYTDHHGLRSVVADLVGVDMKKEQQTTNWGAVNLTEEQKIYAKNDVYYLHRVRAKLIGMLEAEGRMNLVQKYFDFLNVVVEADLSGFSGDFFSHNV